MKFLESVKTAVKVSAVKTGLRIKAKSPEILLVCGTVAFVGTVVVACKQTLKAEEILDEHEKKINDILDVQEMAAEDPEHVSYTEKDAQKDRVVALAQTTWEFAKLYAPAIGLGIVSMACFAGSYGIMKKRNVAYSLAYTALDKAFKDYRGRVRDELGEDTDRYFRYGYKTVQNAKVLNSSGEVEEKEVDVVPWDEDEGKYGPRDRGIFVFAPETSKHFQIDELHNDVTISASRNNMQIDFDQQGFLFLNDVLKNLGMEQVPNGQLVGWLKGYGDPYIDYRVKKVYRELPQDKKTNLRGVFGDYECVYEMDFNTCGEIWDKI